MCLNDTLYQLLPLVVVGVAVLVVMMQLTKFLHDSIGLTPQPGKGLEVRGDHGASKVDLMNLCSLMVLFGTYIVLVDAL